MVMTDKIKYKKNLNMQKPASLNFIIRKEQRRRESALGASERRRAVLEVLCQRRQDTRENLAHEFGVSLRTISNDIDELSRTYPIITIRGKYGGGIKVLDGYRLDQKISESGTATFT